MGMANYYMKAVYPTKEIAVEKMPEVESFLFRMNECEAMWQEIRSNEDFVTSDNLLRERFPDVFEGLRVKKGVPNRDREYRKGLNYLAGLLDSPMSGLEYEMYGCTVVGNSIRFYGEVWHFANWDGLKDYLIRGGAQAAGWLSDENTNVNFFDLINLKGTKNERSVSV